MSKFLRARKTKDPCPGCRLHRSRCLCSLIPRLDLRTRVTLVVHAKELKRTTNTGRLALLALSNSAMYVRGEGRARLDFSEALSDPRYQAVVLFPSQDAMILDERFVRGLGDRPVNLIVPDGNWRQASKVHVRHPELAALPRVVLQVEGRGKDRRLRAESSEFGMATLEAIAHAMGVLEGTAVGAAMLELYREKLERTLAGRPRIL